MAAKKEAFDWFNYVMRSMRGTPPECKKNSVERFEKIIVEQPCCPKCGSFARTKRGKNERGWQQYSCSKCMLRHQEFKYVYRPLQESKNDKNVSTGIN